MTNPFILWESYSQENKQLFFGREKDVKAIKSMLSNHHPVLFGSSGSGKSSICKAGLIPDFYIEDYSDQYLKNVFGSLADFLNSFNTFTGRHPKKPFILLILDQFEKLFYDRYSNINFIEQLIKAILPLQNFRLLISIREENLGDLFSFSLSNRFSLLNDDTGYHLKKMENSKIFEVVKKNFNKSGVNISDRVVGLIIDIIDKTCHGVELSQVQAVCYELFEKYFNQINEVNQETVFSIIDRYYEKLFSSLSDLEKKVLKSGISSTGEKLKISHLVENEDALNSLNTKRIIKNIGLDYEITHEYLLKKILATLSGEEIAVLRMQELVKRSEEDYKFNEDLLIDIIRLKEINKYRDDLNLSIDETELILRSILYNDSSQCDRIYWLKRYCDY